MTMPEQSTTAARLGVTAKSMLVLSVGTAFNGKGMNDYKV
jgi:hypothetical protein